MNISLHINEHISFEISASSLQEKLSGLHRMRKMLDAEIDATSLQIDRDKGPHLAIGDKTRFTYLDNESRIGTILNIRWNPTGFYEYHLSYRGQDKHTVTSWVPEEKCWDTYKFHKARPTLGSEAKCSNISKLRKQIKQAEEAKNAITVLETL